MLKTVNDIDLNNQDLTVEELCLLNHLISQYGKLSISELLLKLTDDFIANNAKIDSYNLTTLIKYSLDKWYLALLRFYKEIYSLNFCINNVNDDYSLIRMRLLALINYKEEIYMFISFLNAAVPNIIFKSLDSVYMLLDILRKLNIDNEKQYLSDPKNLDQIN